MVEQRGDGGTLEQMAMGSKYGTNMQSQSTSGDADSWLGITFGELPSKKNANLYHPVNRYQSENGGRKTTTIRTRTFCVEKHGRDPASRLAPGDPHETLTTSSRRHKGRQLPYPNQRQTLAFRPPKRATCWKTVLASGLD